MKPWIGIECEGRLKGVKTLFVIDEAPDVNVPIDHVYFNPEFMLKNGYDEIRAFVRNHLVSICVTPEMIEFIPPDVMKRVHVVVALKITRDVFSLKETDEIRLDVAPYHNATGQFSSFSIAIPSNYKGDKPYDDQSPAKPRRSRG